MRFTDKEYEEILRSELIPAMGCTEPIAIALASAKARATLGEIPDSMVLFLSGNIIKNVKGVTVPNSGGMKGMDTAAILGALCGDEKRELEVLSSVTEADIEKMKELRDKGYCECRLQEGVENLYVRAVVTKGEHTASVTISDNHTHIIDITKDDEVLYHEDVMSSEEKKLKKQAMTLDGIYDYATTCDLEPVRPILERQLQMNEAIAKESLTGHYGAQVGRTLIKSEAPSVNVRARAYAAAASDARMGGCALPVVINSGSGNQGITVSLPLLVYAQEYNLSEERLFRALILANLTAIHQKSYIGSLSAFCGAVSAACGTGAGITYLYDGSFEQIANTIVNTLANTSGIICDGAKASCAAKIASAVEAAILAHNMSMDDLSFHPGDGVVLETVEETMKSIGYVGRVGMKETDHDILQIMLGNVKFQ